MMIHNEHINKLNLFFVERKTILLKLKRNERVVACFLFYFAFPVTKVGIRLQMEFFMHFLQRVSSKDNCLEYFLD